MIRSVFFVSNLFMSRVSSWYSATRRFRKWKKYIGNILLGKLAGSLSGEWQSNWDTCVGFLYLYRLLWILSSVQVFAVIRDIVLVIVVPKVVVSCRCWVILCRKSRPIWGHTTLTCGYLRSTQWTCTDWICMDLFVSCSLFSFLHFCLWVSRTMANLKQAFLHVFA